MRRRKKPGAQDKIFEFEKYICADPENYKGKWNEYFNNSHPVHIEIGTGKGQFIIGLAEQNPHINFIGLEKKEEVLLRALEKVQCRNLNNIAFLWYDAEKLDFAFTEKEIQRIYINFCDPWPKKRWSKRRLTHRNYLTVYQSLLQNQGEIHFRTDNEQLFEFTLNELADCMFHLKRITFDLHRSKTVENTITTEYEDKFVTMGLKIFSCQALWLV